MTDHDKSRPMPVKHWSFAGLMLTYWCNARCASCYVCSSPSAGGDMSVEAGLAFWEGIQAASPNGCRIHIGGGEPFGRWEILIELVRRAKTEGLGPLEAVETNAFWACNEKIIRERLAALDDAGMGRLTISSDPYHQQFVPIERVRLLARVGENVLGSGRIRIRWRDWAEEGFDTDSLSQEQRRRVFADYARSGRDRLAGRAAAELAGLLPTRPASVLSNKPCWDRLLRSRHVHIDGGGIVCPGTCAGIILGRVTDADSVGRLWQNIGQDFADMDAGGTGPARDAAHLQPVHNCTGSKPVPPIDVLKLLARSGPVALMAAAGRLGYIEREEGYAGRCHLCWSVRRWLFKNGYFPDRLGPACVYRP